MNTPKRIQMRRDRPWRKDNPDAVIVDRRTKWGNPFKISDPFVHDAAAAVDMFQSAIFAREFLTEKDAQRPTDSFTKKLVSLPTEMEIERALRGKDLACWCPLDQPCHADVLLEIANRDKAE